MTHLAGTVLIIAEEASIPSTMCSTLEHDGYQCEWAASVPEAMAKLTGTRFDVVLLDLQAGEFEGLMALRKLKEIAPTAVGIVLTGHGSLDTAIKALQAGADDILIKPIAISRLRASLARVSTLSGQLDERNDELVRVNAQLLTEIAESHALRELNRLKEELIMMVSHDLKGPLTSIKGYAQLLMRRLSGPEPDLEQVARGLTVIDSQAGGLARLLDDLLDASRLQTESFELRAAQCRIDTCLATVLDRLNPTERARVDTVLPSSSPRGDWEEQRIEQVLANLVGNALKYSPEHERVTVIIEQRIGQVEVAVRDHGLGMPPEELPRLFERFHRAPQAHASGLPGTGLGLYLARGIVEAHGGRIWAESPGVGQGATFRFTLPSDPPESAPPQSHTGENS